MRHRGSLAASAIAGALLGACAGSQPPLEPPAAVSPAPSSSAVAATSAVVPPAVPAPAPPLADDAGAAANAASDAATTPAPSAPTLPKSAFTWVCDVGHSGGQDIVVAVKDAGSSFTFAHGDSTDGPFEAVDGADLKNLFRTVIEGKALRDPDFADFYKQASVKNPALVSKVVVYMFVVRPPWSFGIAVARDAKGRELGHAGWSMRPANARPCAP